MGRERLHHTLHKHIINPFFLSGWAIFLFQREVEETGRKRERERERAKLRETERETESPSSYLWCLGLYIVLFEVVKEKRAFPFTLVFGPVLNSHHTFLPATCTHF